MAILTQALLQARLHFNPETGVFTRLATAHCPKVLVGKPAGYERADGYLSINVAGQIYLAHRLAWLYMTGQWPDDMVDHINGARNDNRWSNLRAADMALNQQNQIRPHADSTTGLLGVFKTRNGRFKSQIALDKTSYYLGTFDRAEDAAAAYRAAKATGSAA